MLVPIATAAWLTRRGQPYMWTVQYILCGIIGLMEFEFVDTLPDEYEETGERDAPVRQTPSS